MQQETLRELRLWIAGAWWLAILMAASGAARAEPGIRIEASGETVQLDVFATESGEPLALGVGFDSDLLDFEGFTEIDPRGLLARPNRAQRDPLDADASPATDRTLRLVWLDPKMAAGGVLASLRFRPSPEVDAGDVWLTVFPLSAHRSFEARRWTLDGDATPMEPPPKRLVPAPESYPRAIRKMAEACSPDVDGNGAFDGLTDGLLMLRHLFGFSGPALTAGAVGAGATRSTPAEIQDFLLAEDCRPMLDVDGSDTLDGLTDGLLIARYLFGFTGSSLVDGVLGEQATRRSGDDVDIWLSYYENPRFVVAEGMAGPGEEVTDVFQDLRVRAVGSEPIAVRVVEGRNRQGQEVFNFEIEGEAEIDFVDPNRDAATSGGSAANGYPVDRCWASGRSIFLQGGGLPGTNRIPGRRYDGSGFVVACVIRDTHQLLSVCDKGDDACLSAGDPVLFVHGFTLEELGGGEDTWGDFPALLYEDESNPRYVPFEFRWNSRARFQNVGAELGASIESIALETGKQVHLVGHSFGGILIRTLLQQALAEDPRFAAIDDYVASVITLGTPHAGIADDEQTMHGVAFPRGQDTQGALTFDFFELCAQITCHQMGEPVFDAEEASLFGVDVDTGRIAAELANVSGNTLPSLDILALLGFTTERFANNRVDEGDALITGWGQRFLPSLSVTDTLATQWLGLADASAVGSGRVTERILGFADNNMAQIQPGAANPEAGNAGYKHIDIQETDATPEVLVNCTTRASCGHDGFAETLAWLNRFPAGMAPTRPEIPLELRVIDGVGSPLPGATVRLMDGSALVAEGITGPQGVTNLILPFVPSELFTYYVTLEGFRSGTGTVRTFEVPSETPTQLGDIILRSDQPGFGDLVGTVVDALTGAPLAGATLTLTRIDQITPVRSAVSSGDGGFAAGNLIAERYVLAAELVGYEPTERVLDVFEGTTTSLQVGLSPELQGDGTLRIVLTWAEDPRDLDSHLWKFRADGSEEYHIFYADRLGTGGDFLDRDDTSSFGPETTTIQDVDPTARYVFAVFDFAGSGSIATTSQARVTVQLGNGTSRVFTPPPGGNERWWTVFEVIDGTVQPCNTGCLGNIEPVGLVDGGLPEALWHKPIWMKNALESN
ncbi:MAG: alpha/beta fold hydrolase [Acidobacteriota bacterium]